MSQTGNIPNNFKSFLEKFLYMTPSAIQKLPGILHPVRIYQLLEVAPEVVVHRVAQVGRIRAEYKIESIILINRSISKK